MNPPGNRLCDAEGRRLKAGKIVAVLAQHRELDLASVVCADIGCAYGLITHELASYTHLTIGIERDGKALRRALSSGNEQLHFIQADALALPLPDSSIGLVVCAQVYEHVIDDRRLYSEIWRVLKPGGACFFSGPNRLFPYEFHWRLPFIHWLPQQLAQRVACLIRGDSAEVVKLRSYWSLKHKLYRFELIDYTAAMIKDVERYHLQGELERLSWLRRLPIGWLRALSVLAPNFNWLLVKPEVPPS